METIFIEAASPTRKLMDKNQISFVAFRPIGQGLLLDKYKKDSPLTFENGDHRKGIDRFSVERLTKLEPKLEQLKEKFGSSIEELARAALQYLLYYPVMGTVIPGFRNLKQVKINLSAMDKPLTDEEFDFINKVFAD
jgi:aryl-alcohol dehydrogenase-like predicted oxidoreductase